MSEHIDAPIEDTPAADGKRKASMLQWILLAISFVFLVGSIAYLVNVLSDNPAADQPRGWAPGAHTYVDESQAAEESSPASAPALSPSEVPPIASSAPSAGTE